MATIHIVRSEKGGVGKTFFASHLTEHALSLSGAKTALFDADLASPVFSTRYSAATPVDLLGGRRTDAIYYAAAENGCDVILDTPAASAKNLSSWISGSHLLEAARDDGVQIIMWHIINGDPACLPGLKAALDEAADMLENAEAAQPRHVVVRNMGLTQDGFAAYLGLPGGVPSPAKIAADAIGAADSELLALDSESAALLASAPGSFADRAGRSRREPGGMPGLTSRRVLAHLASCSAEITRCMSWLDSRSKQTTTRIAA